MCGIAGYCGFREALPIVLDAMKRLEYRGYDSAGIAVLENGMEVHKAAGEMAVLEARLPKLKGKVAIGHTRWATHGKPSDENAHPFIDCDGQIALIHNGIIENFLGLKEGLLERGHTFTSDTDTEVIVHLLEEAFDGNLEGAVRTVVPKLEGSYAFVTVASAEKGKIVAVRKETPLIVGLGAKENYIASDVPALLKETNKVLEIHDGEMVVVTPEAVKLTTIQGEAVDREPKVITWTVDDAEKGGFRHFMLKEIFETPEAVHNTLLGRLADGDIEPAMSNHFDSVKIIACGTSFHAGLTGKYILEELAKTPCTAELASEYRYSSPALERPLVVLISQSGETLDTIAAAREARRRGLRTLAVSNYMGSSLTREVHRTIYTRAGIEIGVAASKTFTTQLVALYLMAIDLGLRRGAITHDMAKHLRDELRTAPRVIQRVLDNASEIRRIAETLTSAKDMFFLGRHVNYPVALEGALKMKEISYIHAEGYPAGELKHGPLALLTEETPVVAVAVQDHTYRKMLSNIGEVSARGSPVVAIGFEGDRELEKYVDEVLYVPKVEPIFVPLPVTIVLQLLAYYAADALGQPIDKPRHLAKSVTVE
jgi:glucosamine--fructose-6-phosphate aminotransferase (isomerizing)